MENQKKLNNKGFSLVELIIVVAIMAILVGVMAPQLMKYLEKTNVSSDTQAADAIKTAVQTAIMDPVVINETASQTAITALATAADVLAMPDPAVTEFHKAILETLGVAKFTDLKKEFKSHGTDATDFKIMVSISNLNRVKVVLENTDKTGKKNKYKTEPSPVPADHYITVE